MAKTETAMEIQIKVTKILEILKETLEDVILIDGWGGYGMDKMECLESKVNSMQEGIAKLVGVLEGEGE